MHAHSHAKNETAHDPHLHTHTHPPGLRLRALFVGMMHGMAGSAALILLTLETVRSLPLGLLYVALFGTGSILGMALLSAIIAIPLRYSEIALTRGHNGLLALFGLATVALGGALIYQIAPLEGLLL